MSTEPKQPHEELNEAELNQVVGGTAFAAVAGPDFIVATGPGIASIPGAGVSTAATGGNGGGGGTTVQSTFTPLN